MKIIVDDNKISILKSMKILNNISNKMTDLKKIKYR